MESWFSIQTKQKIKRLCAKVFKSIISKQSKNLSVILNYHSVQPQNTYSTKPQDFSRQMEYLVGEFNIVSLPEFYRIRCDKKELPNKLAMVTFDDGYEDNYKYAFSILNKYGIKATIFVTTGFINGAIDISKDHIAYRGLKPLTWEQIVEMKKVGISFGAHTHTHQILAGISLEDAEKEIAKSRNILEEKLREPVQMFAYPFGQRRTFNDSIVRLLRMHDFKLACSTVWGSDNGNTDIFALHRIRIDALDSFDDFKNKVNGYWDFIKWFQLLRNISLKERLS